MSLVPQDLITAQDIVFGTAAQTLQDAEALKDFMLNMPVTVSAKELQQYQAAVREKEALARENRKQNATIADMREQIDELADRIEEMLDCMDVSRKRPGLYL